MKQLENIKNTTNLGDVVGNGAVIELRVAASIENVVINTLGGT
jgi:hypothetical protein